MPPRGVCSKRWQGNRAQPAGGDRVEQLRRPPLVPRQDSSVGHPHVQPPEQPSGPCEALVIPGRVIDVDILQDEQQSLVAEVDHAAHLWETQARRQPFPEVGEIEVHFLTPPPTTECEQGVL